MTDPHPWITAARRFNLPGPGSQPALIAVLSPAGLRMLCRAGHATVAAACAPGLPAASVRFIDASRREFLRAAATDALAGIFKAPFPERPVVLGAHVERPTRAQLALGVPPDLCCLRGHFAGLPVVPGAMQLGWVLGFASEFLGASPVLRVLQSVKFQRLIQPRELLELAFELDPGSDKVQFEYRSAAGRHSSGRILLGAAGD